MLLCGTRIGGNRLWFCPPARVVCFHKGSKQPHVLAIRVMPINLCECGLLGIRGNKWPRRWDMGRGRQLNRGT